LNWHTKIFAQITYQNNLPICHIKMTSLDYNPRSIAEIVYLPKWIVNHVSKSVAKMMYPNDLPKSHSSIWVIELTCKWHTKMTYQDDLLK